MIGLMRIAIAALIVLIPVSSLADPLRLDAQTLKRLRDCDQREKGGPGTRALTRWEDLRGDDERHVKELALRVVEQCGFVSLLEFQRLMLRVAVATADELDEMTFAQYPQGITPEVKAKQESALAERVRTGAMNEEDRARRRRFLARMEQRIARAVERHRDRAAHPARTLDVRGLVEGDDEVWADALGVHLPSPLIDKTRDAIRALAQDQLALSAEERRALVDFRKSL